MSGHDVLDRVADWTYTHSQLGSWVFGLLCGAVTFTALSPIPLLTKAEVIAGLVAAARFMWVAMMHGIDRAIPLGPSDPACARRANR